MAILVVGGAGYIGSHVARTLRRHGYEAILYDNLCAGHAFLAHGFELVVADIADSEAIDEGDGTSGCGDALRCVRIGGRIGTESADLF